MKIKNAFKILVTAVSLALSVSCQCMSQTITPPAPATYRIAVDIQHDKDPFNAFAYQGADSYFDVYFYEGGVPYIQPGMTNVLFAYKPFPNNDYIIKAQQISFSSNHALMYLHPTNMYWVTDRSESEIAITNATSRYVFRNGLMTVQKSILHMNPPTKPGFDLDQWMSDSVIAHLPIGYGLSWLDGKLSYTGETGGTQEPLFISCSNNIAYLYRVSATSDVDRAFSQSLVLSVSNQLVIVSNQLATSRANLLSVSNQLVIASNELANAQAMMVVSSGLASNVIVRLRPQSDTNTLVVTGGSDYDGNYTWDSLASGYITSTHIISYNVYVSYMVLTDYPVSGAQLYRNPTSFTGEWLNSDAPIGQPLTLTARFLDVTNRASSVVCQGDAFIATDTNAWDRGDIVTNANDSIARETNDLQSASISQLLLRNVNRYTAGSSSYGVVQVLATSNGVTATMSASSLSFSGMTLNCGLIEYVIPTGVRLISTRILWDGRSGGYNNIVVDTGTGDWANTSWGNRCVPSGVGVFDSVTGLPQNDARGAVALDSANYKRFRISSLSSSHISLIDIVW